MAEQTDSPAVVISRPDRIGDVIISTSLMEPLREQFPQTPIYFLAPESLRPLLQSHPLLAGFISISSDLTSELTRIGPSTIVHLHPSEDCYRAAYEARIPTRIGYAEGRSRYLTHSIRDRRAEGLQHEGEYCFDLLEHFGLSKPRRLRPTIHLAESDKTTLQSKLSWDLETTRFAMISASAYSAKKEWPLRRFISLAQRMETELGLTPAFVGARALNNYPPPYSNLSGQTSLGELGWLLKHSQLLVSNDTGVSHIAAAVGCPSIVIFGRTDPEYGPTRWRPLSDRAVVVTSPARRRHFEPTRAFWRRSFAAISVESVFAAVKAIAPRPIA